MVYDEFSGSENFCQQLLPANPCSLGRLVPAGNIFTLSTSHIRTDHMSVRYSFQICDIFTMTMSDTKLDGFIMKLKSL